MFVTIMLRLFILTCVVLCVTAAPAEVQPENRNFSAYQTIPNIRSEGYIAEVHHVTTEDGYILEMHRIPYKRQEQQGDENRPVVFLMHGLYSASNGFIYLGPESAISYNLADAGFDVWMGNARGNKNSRRHVTLDPDNYFEKRQFFDFSWEEIGMYDVSAMVDYVLNATGKQQLHYVGHSQGGTVFLVLNSMRVEYNAKFASAHLLSGVGYMDHFPNKELQLLSPAVDVVYNLAELMGNVEMYPPTEEEAASAVTTKGTKADHCFGGLEHKALCDAVGIRHLLREKDEESSNTTGLSTAGGSLKQTAHYGQNVRDKRFQRWSYSRAENMEEYGTPHPPAYDISLITVNVTMHYTISDDLLDQRDVLAMVNDMPNTVARKIARDSFLHVDFVVAPDVKELVTDYIIEAIRYVEEHLILNGTVETGIILIGDPKRPHCWGRGLFPYRGEEVEVVGIVANPAVRTSQAAYEAAKNCFQRFPNILVSERKRRMKELVGIMLGNKRSDFQMYVQSALKLQSVSKGLK